ncbi:hypothetical protein HNQ65_004092 [Prosthecobacter vanneervenii]|uniref:Uncharacterized protein n=2 Tax=Prosthecobacter vanneervenii TaxID=48466 RepID=A0A7W8DLT1_9BACT|nr:hypothetical protein [Prosthecobacter vanneervenii]
MAEKIDRRWIRIKTQIQHSRDLPLTLSALKTLDNPALIRSWMPNLISIERAKAIIAPAPKPQAFSEIKSEIELVDTDWWREAIWVGSILVTQRTLLRAWYLASEKIEIHTLKREFKEALTELDYLERQVGVSLWSLNCRLALLAQSDGVEAQKNFAKQIWNTEGIHPIVQMLAYYSSIRNEPRVSCWRFDGHTKDACESVESDEDLAIEQFIFFFINFYGPMEFKNPSSILWRHGTLPAIDLYLALIKCAAIAIASEKETNNIPQEWIFIAKALYKAIPDNRLNNLILCWTGNIKIDDGQNDDELLECFDHYTQGNYHVSAELAFKAINKRPNEFSFVELAAKSCARMQMSITADKVQPAEIREILNEMLHVLLKTFEAEKSANSLRKRCYIDSDSAFYAQLFGFCQREFMSDGFAVTRYAPSYSYLTSNHFNPRLALAIEKKEYRTAYLTELLSRNPNSPTLRLYLAMFDGSALTDELYLCRSRLQLFEARRLIMTGNAESAITVLRSIDADGDPLAEQDKMLALVRAAISAGNWSLSIRTMVSAYVKNPNILTRLPLQEVFQHVQRLDVSSECYSDIAFPIASHICTQYFGSEFEFIRDSAYEEFLHFCGVTRPSQLADSIASYDSDELVYFLKNVSIESALDNLITFTSTEDIQHERIAILRLIMSIRPEESHYCSEQIKEITKVLVVRRALRQVEQSGIHVEVNGIKRVIEKSLRESYTRYQDLCASDNIGVNTDFLIRLGLALRVDGSDFQLLLPGDERRSLLTEMFCEVRDHFVSNNEFGLDGYLSTGMRHGTLAGQLRAPFERENLITQRDDNTNIYRDPQVWLEHYSGFPTEKKESLAESIRRFSMDIDALIERTRVQWIQIRTERSTGEGMFDFRVPSYVITALQQVIESTTSYENFIDLLFDSLWQITDECLQLVREEITVTLKNDISKRVSSLENEIRSLMADQANAEILAAITRSGTESQYAVDKIANWFRRAPIPEMEPYSMDLPISIAKEFMLNLFPNCKLDIKVYIHSELQLHGASLKSVVQILFILLDNIKNHSGLLSVEIPVDVIVKNDENLLTLEVINDLASVPNIETRREHLRSVLLDVGQGNRFSSVPIEGGSGLQKIERISRVDLQCDPKLIFDFVEGNRFFAQVSLPYKNLIYENTDSRR